MSQDNLNELLNATKKVVFTQKAAIFLGTLLCQCPVVFAEHHEDGRYIETAETNGHIIWWNPKWFMTLTPKARAFVLLHELWHIAYLHLVRCDNRNPFWWNVACDFVINNMLIEQGHVAEGIQPLVDPQYTNMNAEKVYDLIMQQNPPMPKTGSWGEAGGQGDMNLEEAKQMTPEEVASVVKKVQQARASAEMVGGKDAGVLPGDVTEFIESFYKNKVNWSAELSEYVFQIISDEHTWQRPNRRFEDIYLPSRDTEDKLLNVHCYNDCSGSVTQAMVKRLTSELKYIYEVLQPEKLTLYNFDTRIQSKVVYEQESHHTIDKVKIVGRGGTCLSGVYKNIQAEKPDLVIVFSDLFCAPMAKWEECPIVWLCVDNPNAKVNSGKLIHVDIE